MHSFVLIFFSSNICFWDSSTLYVRVVCAFLLSLTLYVRVVCAFYYQGGSQNMLECCCRLRVIPRPRKHSSVPPIGMVFWSYYCYHIAAGHSPLDWWSPPPWTASLSQPPWTASPSQPPWTASPSQSPWTASLSQPLWTASLSHWTPDSAGATLNIYLYVTQRLWVIRSRVRAPALNHMPVISWPGDNGRALFTFHIWQWSPASHWS